MDYISLTDFKTTYPNMNASSRKIGAKGSNSMALFYMGVFFGNKDTQETVVDSGDSLTGILPYEFIYNCTGGGFPYAAFPKDLRTKKTCKVGGLTFSNLSITDIMLAGPDGVNVPYQLFRFNERQNGSAIDVIW